MKKLFLSLAVAFASMVGMNADAQTLYMMGSGDGLSWEAFPGMAINPGSDGNYSVTINNLNAFKLSTAAATGWDDFNASAIGYGGTYNNQVGSAAGQTVALVPWGENQQMPWVGDYTITITGDLTSMTVKTTTPEPTEATPVYVRGNMNGWGTADEWKFNYNSAAGAYVLECAISAGVEFKIADANWGTINYSVNGATAPTGTIELGYNGQNMSLTEDFEGTLVFKITAPTSAATLAFYPTGEEPDLPDGPAVDPNGKAIYVVGSADGLTWDLPGKEFLPNTDGNYVLNLTNATQFKFSTFNTTEWDGDNGFNAGAYATGDITFDGQVANPGGQTLPLVPWGENQTLPWKGDYTITIAGDFSQMTAYTATPEPSDAPAVYIRGAMNDWGVDETWRFTYYSANEEYRFRCEGATAIMPGVEFKIADADWNAINYSYTGGMVTPSEEPTQLNLAFNSSNMALATEFVGTVIFKITGAKTAYAIFQVGEDTAVEAIETENGTPRYFNLQGVEILNPEKGGIYIQVVNGKASKVVR